VFLIFLESYIRLSLSVYSHILVTINTMAYARGTAQDKVDTNVRRKDVDIAVIR
jgi:hypothetical protein